MRDLKLFICFCLIGIAGLLMFSFCGEKKTDTTYINFDKLTAHDTVSFKNAQQEYEFLVEANNFKREIGDHLFTAVALIEELMDTYPCEKAFTIDEIDNILTKVGYYKEIAQVDSLLRLSM